MKLAGLNFKKILCERKGESLEGVKINANIDISSIEEIKGSMFKTEQLINIGFKYGIKYDPDFAKIELEGNIIIGDESRVIREVVKEWKEKKLPMEFKVPLFNLIIKKCSVKALELEDEIGVPYHMPFPSLKAPEEEKAEEKKE